MLPLNLVRHFCVRRDMNSRISLINPTKKFYHFSPSMKLCYLWDHEVTEKKEYDHADKLTTLKICCPVIETLLYTRYKCGK